MHKAWLVAKHEYLTNIKRKGFLFGAFGVPLLVVAIMVIVAAIAVDSETNTERVGAVGYVDQSGILADPVDQPETYRVYASADDAQSALNSGEIGAYFVVQPDYMNTGGVQLVSGTGVPEALLDEFDEFLVANVGRSISPDLLERLKDPVEMSVVSLDSGRVIEESAIFALIFAPIIFVFVFIMASQTTSGYLMSGVVEEKSSRIMEILVTSITPFQLLFGKILGLGALGLTQLIIWIGGAYITLSLGQNLEFLAGVTIPTDLLIIGIIYFLLGYFFLASLMAGIGAVVGSEQESRQFAGIFSLVLVIPFFAITTFITDPNGAVPIALTLFPLTSPVSVMLRMGFASIPAWQLIVSIALLLLTTIFTVWASAKIFRWALLMYGKRPGLREILRALRRPPTMATTATGERAG
jgi:ABC-2 type transport system permease protein